MEDVKKRNSKDIFYAISHGKVRQISNTINQKPECLQLRSSDGKTPLIYVICEANESIRSHLLRMCLRAGSDVNACDENGRSALMYAAMDYEKVDLVRILSRSKGCNANLQDNEGDTAIMHAIMCANSSAIRILVNSSSTKSSIDLSLRNTQDLNALELAIKLQMAECCKVLVCEGGANSKQVKNQVGLMRLLEDENLIYRSNTPHSRNPSRSTFMKNFRKMDSPILENKQFEGSYMSRDTTPNYDDYAGYGSERGTPLTYSRQNSLNRTNSNLYRRRPEAGSRPSSLNANNNDALGILNSQKGLKRALTPISARNTAQSPAHIEVTPNSEQTSFGQRTRLPSIPSGRKLYLVSSPNTFNAYDN